MNEGEVGKVEKIGGSRKKLIAGIVVVAIVVAGVGTLLLIFGNHALANEIETSELCADSIELYPKYEKNLQRVVWSIDWGKNDSYLLISSIGNSWIYDAENGNYVNNLSQTQVSGSGYDSISWGGINDTKVIASKQGNVTIWDVIQIGNESIETVITTSSTSYATWSPDGSYVVISNKSIGATIYHYPSFEVYDNTSGGKSTFSPNGEFLAIGTSDEINIYSMAEKKISKTIPKEANLFDWSPDGNSICLISNKNISIWDIESNSEISNFIDDKAEYRIVSLDWSPTDYNLIVIGNDNGIVEIWNITTGTMCQYLYFDFQVYWTENGESGVGRWRGDIPTVKWSDNGNFLAAGAAGNLKVWTFDYTSTYTKLGMAVGIVGVSLVSISILMLLKRKKSLVLKSADLGLEKQMDVKKEK